MNLRERNITTLPAMLIERSAHASVFLEGSIFVAGGQTTTKKNTKYLDKMEKYAIQFS